VLCRSPIGAIARGGMHGCGQCIPCRVNRRRIWSSRIQLEALTHVASSFVTLTYSDAHLPPQGALMPLQLQLFFKRLRKGLSYPIRFFAVGEYGEESLRPHYHAAVFGLRFEHWANVRVAWPFGFTSVGELSPQSANYVAGYCMKKLSDNINPAGRPPEFLRCSNRPGIGAKAMEVIAAALKAPAGAAEIAALGDVPASFRMGGRNYLFGRYLHDRLRKAVGFDQAQLEAVKARWAAEASGELLRLFAHSAGLRSLPSPGVLSSHLNCVRITQITTRSKLQPRAKI